MVFLDFFYALRSAGLKSTLQEWRMLLTCLEKGLHKSTVEGFYHVARACLVKSESDFDTCLLYTSPSPRDKRQSRMPSSA